MSLPVEQPKKVIPAQLGFLAIYNPSLGTTDETLENQLVYYSSPEAREQSRQPNAADPQVGGKDVAREQKNEQLRQIGLAQGMVEFGRSFSDGRAVDTIETEKSRIVLHELEAGWWILAVCRSSIHEPPTNRSLVDQPHCPVRQSKHEQRENIGAAGVSRVFVS